MLKVFKTRSEVEKRIAALGEELTIHLSKEAREHGIVLVGNLKGSFMFLSDLAKEISLMNCRVEFIQTSREKLDEEDNSQFSSLQVEGKTIIFVEDIVDSGKTIELVRREFEKLQIKRLVVASLLVRKNNTHLVDYYGFQLNTDRFIIGYGMDDKDGTKRNMPNIYTREKEIDENL